MRDVAKEAYRVLKAKAICTFMIGDVREKGYVRPLGMDTMNKIDTNTAETFRHGIWYVKGDVKQRLDIVPLTLAQFRKYFVAMFKSKIISPERLKSLILECESNRDAVDAPMWKSYIEDVVNEKEDELCSRN